MHPTTLMSQMVHRFPDCCIGVMWSCHHASHYPNGIELPWIFILLSWISISEPCVWQDSGTILTLISEWFIYLWIVVVFVKCFFSQTKRMATNAPNVTTSPALLALIWIVSPDPFTNIRGDSTYIDRQRPHRGGRGSKNRPILWTNSIGNADEGGGRGSKIPKILWTYLMDGP